MGENEGEDTDEELERVLLGERDGGREVGVGGSGRGVQGLFDIAKRLHDSVSPAPAGKGPAVSVLGDRAFTMEIGQVGKPFVPATDAEVEQVQQGLMQVLPSLHPHEAGSRSGEADDPKKAKEDAKNAKQAARFLLQEFPLCYGNSAAPAPCEDDILIVMGESGAGKSTLVKHLQVRMMGKGAGGPGEGGAAADASPPIGKTRLSCSLGADFYPVRMNTGRSALALDGAGLGDTRGDVKKAVGELAMQKKLEACGGKSVCVLVVVDGIHLKVRREGGDAGAGVFATWRGISDRYIDAASLGALVDLGALAVVFTGDPDRGAAKLHFEKWLSDCERDWNDDGADEDDDDHAEERLFLDIIKKVQEQGFVFMFDDAEPERLETKEMFGALPNMFKAFPGLKTFNLIEKCKTNCSESLDLCEALRGKAVGPALSLVRSLKCLYKRRKKEQAPSNEFDFQVKLYKHTKKKLLQLEAEQEKLKGRPSGSGEMVDLEASLKREEARHAEALRNSRKLEQRRKSKQDEVKGLQNEWVEAEAKGILSRLEITKDRRYKHFGHKKIGDQTERDAFLAKSFRDQDDPYRPDAHVLEQGYSGLSKKVVQVPANRLTYAAAMCLPKDCRKHAGPWKKLKEHLERSEGPDRETDRVSLEPGTGPVARESVMVAVTLNYCSMSKDWKMKWGFVLDHDGLKSKETRPRLVWQRQVRGSGKNSEKITQINAEIERLNGQHEAELKTVQRSQECIDELRGKMVGVGVRAGGRFFPFSFVYSVYGIFIIAYAR